MSQAADSSDQRARRFPSLITVVILVAVAAFHVRSLVVELPVRSHRWDFSLYYSAALAMRHGINPYTTNLTPLADRYGLETGTINRAADTPTFLLMFEPLTFMEVVPAFWTWTILNAIFLAAALYLLPWKVLALDNRSAWFMVALAIIYLPLAENIRYSQAQVLVLVLITIMMLALNHGYDRTAGAALAVATMLRGFPALLLLYLLLRKRWNAALWCVGWIVALGVLTLALVGVDRSMSFLTSVGIRDSGYDPAHPANLAWSAVAGRIASSLTGSPSDSPHFVLHFILVLLGYGAIAVLTLRATLTPRAGAEGDNRALGIWLPATVLAAPIAWFHYLVLLLVPFALATAAAIRRQTTRRVGVALVIAYLAIPLEGGLIAFLQAYPSALKSIGGLGALQVVIHLPFVTIALAFLAAYWLAVGGNTSNSAAVASTAKPVSAQAR